MYSRRRGGQVAGIGSAADAAADAARDIAESQPVEDDPRLVRAPRWTLHQHHRAAAKAAVPAWLWREGYPIAL